MLRSPPMTEPDDRFTLPDPRMASIAWYWDSMHTPRPLPPLVGDAHRARIEGISGRPAAIVNGYGYMGLGPPTTPVFALEQSPETDPATAWREFYLPRIRAIWGRTQAADYGAMSAAALADELPRIVRDSAVGFAYTMAPLMAISAPMTTLMEFCGRHFGADGDLRAMTMLSGFENTTTGTGEGLGRLAELGAELPAVASTLASGRFEAIQGVEGGPRFMEALRVYLADFGAASETWFGFHTPTWSEDPVRPLQMIANYVRNPASNPLRAHERAARVREETVRETLAALPAGGDRERLRGILAAAHDYVSVFEERARWQIMLSASLRTPSLALGEKLRAGSVLGSQEDIFFFQLSELPGLVRGALDGQAIAAERRAAFARWERLTPPATLGAPLPGGFQRAPMVVKMFGFRGEPGPVEDVGLLKGAAASRGLARGVARVVTELDDSDRLADGEVLVCRFTAPPWTPLFSIAAAVVTDAGGVLSHAAIAAREYAIPCVTGTGDATQRIPDGTLIEVDGGAGTVRIL